LTGEGSQFVLFRKFAELGHLRSFAQQGRTQYGNGSTT
jgi:hypothetical protein